MLYTPKQGEIIILNTNPRTGHKKKRVLGLVVSNDQFNKRTNMAMVCPITDAVSDFPTHVLLDKRTKTTGRIMCEQAKCVVINDRIPTYKETIPDEILEEVIDLICSFVE